MAVGGSLEQFHLAIAAGLVELPGKDQVAHLAPWLGGIVWPGF
jgi:hypothetical protein